MRALSRPSVSLQSTHFSANKPQGISSQAANPIPAFFQYLNQSPQASLHRSLWTQGLDISSSPIGGCQGVGFLSGEVGSVIRRGISTTSAVYRSSETDGGVSEEAPKVIRPQVAIFWDLDNKTPEQDPRVVADRVRSVGERFGQVAEFRAYANRHTFEHIPSYVREERAERAQLKWEQQQGLSLPDEPYRCGVCGQKFKTTTKLDNHFKQLHERERNKKVNRAQSLRKKKPKASKKLFAALKEKNERYFEAARDIIKPKSGYRLMADLKSRGVRVQLVKDRSQAADDALIRDLEGLLKRPNRVDSVVLVSDDSDFARALARIRASKRHVVVIGDRLALQQNADILLPWWDVHEGSVFEQDYRVSPESFGQSQPSRVGPLAGYEAYDDLEDYDDAEDDFESYAEDSDRSGGDENFDQYIDDEYTDDEDLDSLAAAEVDEIIFGKVSSKSRSRRR